ncbi:EamA family transporter [Rhodocytophaga rosea]|uniref:EamA family transporter n=1 Tax=Rhodocytophaga rosea TaxID=2704465 RepID=A0A6C0GN53_9BACT|nr:DMT family transporter [Rhodocytophaga rosea]QHT69367.1 EamA family transporter [Rhodocytophaga rosea]
MPLTRIKENKTTLAWILLIILALIWGSSFILIKKGVAVYSAPQVGSLRIVLAAVILLPLAIIHLTKVPRSKWGILFICGLLGNLIPSFLFSIAGTKLNSSVSGILNALTPLFTLIIGSLFFRKQISMLKITGILVGFAGCVLLIFMNASGNFQLNNYYALLPVAATICYGLNGNLISRYLAGIKPLHIAALSLCFVGPLAGIYLFSTDIDMDLVLSSEGISALGFISILGIVGTALATIIFNKVIQLSGPLFTSSVTYLIPVVALGWGILDGETLNWIQYVSMLAIILGVYVVNKAK